MSHKPLFSLPIILKNTAYLKAIWLTQRLFYQALKTHPGIFHNVYDLFSACYGEIS